MIDILTMWIMLLLPLAVVVVMVLVDILHVGEQTQRVLTVILYILLAAILINLFILPWIRKGIHWALERQKTKARIRDLKTLIRRFETGQPVSTEELIRLLRATGEKETIHTKVLAVLEQRAQSGDPSVVEAIFQWVKEVCQDEMAFMAELDAHNPYYATPFPISLPDINLMPFNLLARFADASIIPALQALYDEIPERVEYREWYDAEHDMIVEEESKARPLIKSLINTLRERSKE